MNYSIVTSFNNRLYDNEHQHVVKSVQEKCPNVDFYVYNENSFLNEDLHIDGATNLDLFKQIPDLKNFLETSKFKDCHKIGKRNSKKYWSNPNQHLLNNEHWNRNSIFWLRKVCAIYDCAKICKTPIMIWLDSDVFVEKSIDETFLNFVNKYDICANYRKNFTGWMYTDMGITVYNLSERTRRFIKEFYNYYKSGKTFTEYRWDDCYIFDLLSARWSPSTTAHPAPQPPDWVKCCGLTKIFGCDFNLGEYFFHDKGWTTMDS